MANKKQLAILEQGAEVWNQWREEQRNIKINLSNANLTGGIHLNKVDLHEADLRGANLSGSNFSGANLSRARLDFSTIINANLSGANLEGANLFEVDLSLTDLNAANLGKTNMGFTILGDIDLSQALGLEEVQHEYPSTVGTNTLQRSKGKIPDIFLRGCGLSDLDIEYTKLYTPELGNREIDNILYRIHDLRAHRSVQISPLFISYSHADTAFVDRLEERLNEKGIRFWRDIHDAKAGKLEKQIEQAIRHNPTVLVVLSKNSMQSDWVEHEVRTARGLEKELKRDVLCPVALDESWKASPWPARVMEQVLEYNVLDFSKWQDEQVLGQMFNKLIDGLNLFYKK